MELGRNWPWVHRTHGDVIHQGVTFSRALNKMANKWLAHVKSTMAAMKKKGTYKKGMGLSQVIKAAKLTYKKGSSGESSGKKTRRGRKSGRKSRRGLMGMME